MAEEQFKRNVAYKMRISDVLNGKVNLSNERFSFLDFNGLRVIRVNIAGVVIDKYDSEGEKRYSFLTLDDGSGQIKLKAFGDEIERVKNVNQGQTVVIIGSLRHFNDEVYISPEIIKEQSPKYLLLRKMELERQNPVPLSHPSVEKRENVPQAKESVESPREKIAELIKKSEGDGGIETEEIRKKINGSPEIVNQEIQRLLEEGIIFEPRPGKVRWLG